MLKERKMHQDNLENQSFEPGLNGKPKEAEWKGIVKNTDRPSPRD
jgi:hypothetical protein